MTKDKIKTIQTEAENLLSKMVDKYELEVSQVSDIYQIIIKTEEAAPTVIGRHGETIRAIQKILEVIFYKQFGEPISLLVNVNDYRERQKERLEQLAQRTVEKVQDLRSSSYLKGLSSYERKIVHEYIVSNYPDLASYSVGEGSDRRLVVDLKENAPPTEA